MLDIAPVKCQQVNRDVAVMKVLKELLENRPVPALRTKSNDMSYSPWVRQASYQLQNIGVSGNISEVRLRNKRNHLLRTLPCSATQNTFTKEIIVTPASL